MKVRQLIQIPVFALILVLFLVSTNPSEIPLPLIVLPYLLGAVIFYRIASVILQTLFRALINGPKLKLYALIITVLMTNFALLKSIGQLTFQDGLISGAIVIISIVYIGKFSLSVKN